LINRKKVFHTNTDKKTSIVLNEKRMITLLYIIWDDKLGPHLKDHFPLRIDQSDASISLEKIGFQLFNGIASIYGQDEILEAQGVLLNIPSLKRTAYSFFDSAIDRKVRGKTRPFMLCVLAPKISYFESLEIKAIFHKLSFKIKTGNRWSIEKAWNEISNLLIISPLSSFSAEL
jgi:hypothetical protein